MKKIFIQIAGWFITFFLVGLTARRSYRFERNKFPQGKLLSLHIRQGIMLRYLVGVYTLWVFMLAGTGITLGILLAKIVTLVRGFFNFPPLKISRGSKDNDFITKY